MKRVAAICIGCLVASCAPDEVSSPEPLLPEVALATVDGSASADDVDAALLTLMEAANAAAANAGLDVRVEMAEWFGSDAVGRTVYFSNVGSAHLAAEFVPHDPRRAPWSGPVDGVMDDIVYAIDIADGSAPSLWGPIPALQTTMAIDNAMATWEAVECSELPITKGPEVPVDIGYTAALGFGIPGPIPGIAGDIMHAGWGDLDAVLPASVLGVTFTWGWPTSDGGFEVAFRDIYYSGNFYWATDGSPGVDIQTVALHESGHGLGLAHFGAAFTTDRNGMLHFSPRTVMNAGYSGIQRDLVGRDLGAHCGIWADWPLE